MGISEAELTLARQVHYAFLPAGYEDEHLAVTVTAEPSVELGGDYCGILQLPDGRVALAMCDATGHSLASALFAARVNTYVLSQAALMSTPAQLLLSLNGFLNQRLQGTNMSATFCLAVVDPRTGEWSFTGAGHPPAIHYRAATGDTVLLKSSTQMLGVFETLPTQPRTITSELESGDRVLLFTDGLIDARNAAGELFGLERLQACVVEHAGLTGRAFHEALLGAALAHGQGDLGDDALLLSVVSKGRSPA